MKSTFLSLVFLLASISLNAQLDWLKVASTADQGTKERFLGVCTGPAGEVYAAGTTTTLTFTQPYLQQFSSLGAPGYDRTLGSGSGTAYDLAFDRLNNRLVVAGDHQGQPYLELIDPTTGSTHRVSPIAGGGVIKAIDVTSNFIYAIGNYSSTLDFGSPVTHSITGGGAFVAQFSLNGNILQTINVRGGTKGFDVKADAAGNIYFTLTTTADIAFGTGFPGNYTYSGSGEDQVMVQANSGFRAQWSSILRNSDFPLSVDSEIPLALDEGAGLVYVATPFEPNTTPTIHGGIGRFLMTTGAFDRYSAVPGREVRDLTVNCGELFAVGGRVQSFGRTTCGNANHVAWYQSFGSTLTPAPQSDATTCSWAGAVTADDFGNVVVAGGFLEAPSLTWDGLTEPSLQRGGAMVAHLPTGQQCCTQSQDICLQFDGFDDHLSFTNSPLQGRTEFTIETWFLSEDTSSPPNYRSLFFNGGTGFGLGVLNGNLALRGGGSTQTIVPITNNRWYHLAVVFENGNLTTYLDCQQVDQQTSVTLSLSNGFFLGQTGSSPGLENWRGRIDEFSVYDYARGPGEIIAGKDCRRSGTEDGLVLYLPLDQGLPGQLNTAETIAFDQSTAANNGTLNNFTLFGQQSNWVCSPIVLGPPCPPPPCDQPLPNNTFSLYQETRDFGALAGIPELDLAYGAFRLDSGQIIFGGVVDGSDTHNPVYFAKTDDQGNVIGSPDLYHPTTGNETIALLKEEPTPIRNATGSITGFLASQLYKGAPGQPEQKVLLQLDLNLNIVNSRVYQSVIPGVSEKFTDILQDSNGDFIAIGQINKTLYNSGFVMRIEPSLNIAAYELIENQNEDIYLDQVIEAAIVFPRSPGGGVTSDYVIGGHLLSGELFFEGLDFNLQQISGAVSTTEPSIGSAANYLAGMARRSDGAMALIGNSKDGRIWVNIFPDVANTLSYESYLIDVDGGREEAYDVTPLSGDRLLIGGRAKSANSSNDDGQAALLELDLNTATVNWVRTYGNANYPESTMIDVYADADGFLLSGYGITAAGVSAGGFATLSHFDSWLAATDTLGRVFDCDCYEDTYATVIPIPFGFSGIVLTFTPVNKGQDDQPQDRTKAPVVHYFCDQYQAPVTPICCGGEDEERIQLVGNTQISEDGQDWVVANPNLPECFTLQIDWGDGTTEAVPAGQLPARHTYAVDGDYDICIAFQADADDGTVCWEETQCEVVTGTEDRRMVADLTVYPNPTDGVVQLRFPVAHGQPSVRVFTMTGQPVRNIAALKGNTFSLAGLPSGVYVLDVRFPDGAVARRKVMVR